eukprot:7069640-Prymnesium_polylepis.1
MWSLSHASTAGAALVPQRPEAIEIGTFRGTFREHSCWMSPGLHSKSMRVGCLEAESGNFWDGGQRPELRAGQYCSGDTRLVMDPYNPMAASRAPVPPIFRPPPTPDSLVNKAALAGLVFSTDSKKFRTFARQFRSAIGTQYEYTMDSAIANGPLNPTDATAI